MLVHTASTVPLNRASSTSAMDRVIGLPPRVLNVDVCVRPDVLVFNPLKSSKVLTGFLAGKIRLFVDFFRQKNNNVFAGFLNRGQVLAQDLLDLSRT